MRDLIDRLLSSKPLEAEEIAGLFESMLSGSMAEAQVAAILAAWRVRGERAEELVAGARHLRKKSKGPKLPLAARPLADNCGTGGDGSASFNISTASAIVASAAGVRIAKHGNRAFSSPCGSADLLFEAGFPEGLGSQEAANLLEATGFTFFFAPNYHPVMKHVATVRKALGVRTIFNLLGPLANPIDPEFQLLGVGTKTHLRPMADALCELPIRRALVVHSHDGLDEVSPCAPTDAILVENGTTTDMIIDPKDFAMNANLEDLKGGEPATNHALLKRILHGEQGGCADAVILNGAALLWVTENADSMSDGVAKIKSVLKSGAAKDHLDKWIAIAKELAGETK